VVDPRALARALAALPVRLDSVRCRSGRVALADYPGGRPFTLVALSGQGQTGFGEQVAFTDREQQAFVLAVESRLACASGPVASIVRADAPPFERAAIEAAVIDLALRQAGVSVGELAGAAEGRFRWVRSFEARRDAAARARAVGGELKVDVHPAWSDAEIEALRRERVVILDFKGAGDAALCARLSAAFPAAIFEDPPEGCRHPRVARDRSLLTEADVAAAVARGELVNLKAPRMGGVLAVLAARAIAADSYFGGMFEAGPGREQSRQLAAVLCPDAPNDLAPLSGALSSITGDSPSPIRLDAPGFGATCDWLDLPIS
jgi:hypothetical protein